MIDKAPAELHDVRSMMTGAGSSSTVDDDVVLVNAVGQPIGRSTRGTVHTTDTPLHLAFSLHLFNPAGRVLLTRRALTKRTWPGVWTNSCCGHPQPGEAMTDAIRRRVAYELGVGVGPLTKILPDFSYRATDASGIVENEICPVYAATLAATEDDVHPKLDLAPNSEEVMDWVWVDWVDLRSAMVATPFAFSPWAVQQVARLAETPRL